jgi:hypothetical protein
MQSRKTKFCSLYRKLKKVKEQLSKQITAEMKKLKFFLCAAVTTQDTLQT